MIGDADVIPSPTNNDALNVRYSYKLLMYIKLGIDIKLLTLFTSRKYELIVICIAYRPIEFFHHCNYYS